VSVDYSDFPVVEWTCYFRNNGKNNTPILKDIQGLNARFEKNGKGEFVLHCNKGRLAARSYGTYDQILGPNTVKRFAPEGGDLPMVQEAGLTITCKYQVECNCCCGLARSMGQFICM